MTTVAIYHKTIPPGNKNLEKPQIFVNYSLGVRAAGDTPIEVNDFNYRDTDIGLIQGWVHSGSKAGGHLSLRNEVIEKQTNSGRYVVAVDSNLFLYKNPHNPGNYLRYSFNGIFPCTGIYCDTEIDPQRWLKLKTNLRLNLRPYRSNGNQVLVCLQRNGGWSMGGVDVQDWAIETIKKLRFYTDRPIIIRGHPGDRNIKTYLDPLNPACRIKGFKDVFFSDPTTRTLEQDLQNTWAVVNCNSSPVVGAAIEGYPIFVLDPNKSQCAEIANTDLARIENPQMPDRQKWVERLSMFHWNFEELRSGECWSHMRKFIK